MNLGSRGPVVIDTGVFGARLTPSGRLLAARYRPTVEGRPAVISFVTVAELEYGARPGKRVRRIGEEVGELGQSRTATGGGGGQAARGR